MATMNLSPLTLYPSEQAVFDQFANRNQPFSRDFSYSWQSPVTDFAGGETVTVNLPLIYIPKSDYLPGVPWALTMQVLGRTDSPAGSGWSSSAYIVANGSNWSGDLTVSELPAAAGEITLTGVVSNTKTTWNMPGHTGHINLNLAVVFGSNVAAHSGTVAIGIVGVHSLLGGFQ